MAVLENGACRLLWRNGHEFKHWPSLTREIADSVRARSVVLDGEIVCLDHDGRPNFYRLMFRRSAPFFCAFDVLSIDGDDLRGLPLLERKRLLFEIMPGVESRLRYVDFIYERGVEFFRLVCERDLEGIVAKWAHGTYQHGPGTSWLKIKNAAYSQMEGRHEIFDSRSFRGRSPEHGALTLQLR